MLLRDDDPRASILLAWLTTRELFDAERIGRDMRAILEVRVPAEAEPWISRLDGLTEDLAKPPADAFLERFHDRPLRALLVRTCRSERPALDSIDVELFERIAAGIDRAFRQQEPDRELRPEELDAVSERAGAALAAYGLVWSEPERAFVRSVAGLVQRVQIRAQRATGGQTGLTAVAVASVHSERLDRAREALLRPPQHDAGIDAFGPLLHRASSTVKIPHRGRVDAAMDTLAHDLVGLAQWVSAFDSPASVLAALVPDGTEWWSRTVPDTDAAWPERRAVFAVMHGLATPREAMASAHDAYLRLGRTAVQRKRAEAKLQQLLERVLTLDPPALGPIAIPAELEEVLRRIRGAGGASTLDRAAIIEAEAALGHVLPNEVLAYLAARSLGPAHVVEATRTAREDGLARWGSAWELGVVVVDLEPEAPFLAAAYRPGTSTRESLDFCAYDLFHGHALDAPRTLAEYLRQRHGATDRASESEELVIDLAGPAPAGTFVAVIEDAPAPAVERVRHPKLGRGTVVERRGDKLVIAFDDGVQRTLLARFCTPE